MIAISNAIAPVLALSYLYDKKRCKDGAYFPNDILLPDQ
jgi:hypothetical protein